jgi:hypothetical protein
MIRSLSSRPSLALLLATLLAAAPCAGQDKAPAPIRHDATTLILPARRIELKELIDATAAFLQVNILTNEAELQAPNKPVELQTPMSLGKQEAEEAVCDLLCTRGFVLAPRDLAKGLYEVIYLTGPRGRDLAQLTQTRTPEEILQRPHLKQPVSTVLPLQHTNANVATNALRPFFQMGAGGAWLSIGTAGNNNAILLTGLQSEVAKAIELVRKADEAPAQKPEAAAAGGDDVQKRLAAIEQALTAMQKQLAELLQRLPAK